MNFDSNNEYSENNTNNYKYEGLQNNQQNESPAQNEKNHDNKDDGSQGQGKSERRSKKASGDDKSYDETERKNRRKSITESTNDSDNTDTESIKKEAKHKNKKNKKEEKSDIDGINITIKSIEDLINKIKDLLKVIKSNTDETNVTTLTKNLNEYMQNILLLIEKINYNELETIPLNPTYDPLKQNKESDFIQHQISLYNKANSTKPFDQETIIPYSIQQKIYYDMALLRDEIIKNTPESKKTLINEINLLNKIIATILEAEVNYYNAKKQDLPFWIKEWEQIPTIKESIDKDPYANLIKNATEKTIPRSNYSI